MSIIGLLVVLVVFLAVIWAARALMSAFGVGDPIATVIYVVLVLVALVFLLQSFGLLGSVSGSHLSVR